MDSRHRAFNQRRLDNVWNELGLYAMWTYCGDRIEPDDATRGTTSGRTVDAGTEARAADARWSAAAGRRGRLHVRVRRRVRDDPPADPRVARPAGGAVPSRRVEAIAAT